MKSWLDYNNYFCNKDKMLEERTKYKVYCKCGHGEVFYPFEKKNKKICSWCGYYVYKNKRIEFKDRLNSLMCKNKIEGVYQ